LRGLSSEPDVVVNVPKVSFCIILMIMLGSRVIGKPLKIKKLEFGVPKEREDFVLSCEMLFRIFSFMWESQKWSCRFFR